MAELRFAWDPDKATSNERKHGVTFEEAQSIFYDQYALQLEDPDEAAEEERFVMLGLSGALRMLTVFTACERRATRSGSFPRGRPSKLSRSSTGRG